MRHHDSCNNGSLSLDLIPVDRHGDDRHEE